MTPYITMFVASFVLSLALVRLLPSYGKVAIVLVAIPFIGLPVAQQFCWGHQLRMLGPSITVSTTPLVFVYGWTAFIRARDRIFASVAAVLATFEFLAIVGLLLLFVDLTNGWTGAVFGVVLASARYDLLSARLSLTFVGRVALRRMAHHIPPDRSWDPEGLSQRLRDKGLQCRTANDTIRIIVTVTDEMIWESPKPDDPDRLERIELQRRIREITKERPGRYEMVIRYLPNKFIRNVILDRDRDMPLKPAIEYEEIIRQTLIEHGYVEITREVEREIANRYFSNREVIESLEKEIEVHQREKENLVESQDFSAAVKARDLEFEARDRLDSIVKNAAKGV